MRKSLALVSAIALSLGACAVHQDTQPSPSGPATTALSITLTATPDTLPQNGTSRSNIVVKAFNAGGQPLPNVDVRLDMQVNNVVQDFGFLFPRTVRTGADGTALATYTAPPGPAAGGVGNQVTLVATPITSDATTGIDNFGKFQTVIRLTASGVVGPPAVSPTASFVVTPAAPTAGGLAVLNASASCAGGTTGTQGACAGTDRIITGYFWDFGDGTTGFGQVVTHAWPNAQPYAVRLTVINDTNVTATTVTVVTVAVPLGAGSNSTPTAAFTNLPNPAQVGQTVTFDGSQSSTAADGVPIVNYFWNFGDGSPQVGSSSPTTSHVYTVAGQYTPSLTVLDAKGRSAFLNRGMTILP